MTTEELSIFGYCCTGSVDSARQPTRTRTRFTTIASTGCRMKTSVKEEREGMARVSVLASACMHGLRDDGCVGDRHQRRLAQLERARGGNLLARRQAIEDHDLVAEHGAGGHGARLG